jgi:Tfp pilus assembly protein PilF
MNPSQPLERVKDHLRKRQFGLARALLREVLRQSPGDEQAWLLAASAADGPAQALYCLEQALKANPLSST